MDFGQANQAYRNTSIQTASQARLITLLFEGAIRFMGQFISAVEKEDIQDAHNNSMKAQRIMTELILALDHEKGGEVSRTIEAAYENIRNRMVRANVRKDKELAKEVIKDLEDFRETWIEVFKRVESGTVSPPPPQAGGVSITT